MAAPSETGRRSPNRRVQTNCMRHSARCMQNAIKHAATNLIQQERSEMRKNRLTWLVVLAAGATLSSGVAMAQAGGNGNGGAGGGNAHGAATAAPTVGGDNTSTPGSTHKGGFHFKHKKKAKPVETAPQ